MATELSEKTKITLDLKTIGIVVGGAISIASLYFIMQADIALAKTLPVPPISKIEYDLKDELIRQTIMDTQDDVEEIKENSIIMRYLNLILLLICFNSYGQDWITDKDFDNKINERQAFGDDQTLPVVVEFWASFNDVNKFEDWSKLKNVIYYRADISQCLTAKKKYRVRMVPTLIVFKEGIKEKMFKAGLDLMLPASLSEIQETINEINTASKF